MQNFVSMFTKPKVFFGKPTFLFVCIVYGGTYITANSIISLCEFNGKDPFWYKLLGTAAVNMTLGILKDKYFAQVFSGKPVSKFPLSSWSLFVLRDTLTIGAGFNLPSMASDFLYKKQLFPSLSKQQTDKVAQIAIPMSCQLILTPIHLLALDFYNNKQASFGTRFRTIFGVYPETTSIRMGRVLCAYGIAGIANTGLRQKLRDIYIPLSK
jgi:hypothetical protein